MNGSLHSEHFFLQASVRIQTPQIETIQILGICSARRATEGRLNRKLPQLTHALHRHPCTTWVGSKHRHVYTPWNSYWTSNFSNHRWRLKAAENNPVQTKIGHISCSRGHEMLISFVIVCLLKFVHLLFCLFPRICLIATKNTCTQGP